MTQKVNSRVSYSFQIVSYHLFDCLRTTHLLEPYYKAKTEWIFLLSYYNRTECFTRTFL
jgi:hypothetical protein